ncbi:FAD:protein FMN transferase [Paramuribaculum intestinale]|uniref:FAD:protein FMN transferase n=1 Tax=Paramuribaculum intestinale TaxID=2094151 RepID=A0A2V1IZA9_9BACT|nr:FAD:protein FMN transferase [Paramuribaculum intestinale]PWB00632.1 FAD:protein FMN transferase [Paramuribaculum intestinale]PWB07876.1 FAD:protein FMN transferase [Paramuribaculum intestinale]ROS92050.1 FAD:protein FMN transferase [Muribaculaceae bacterium Isolate-043 (Harlan)]WLT42857.1 FAD:protein FMN transferase [Paramuribaculum intestinale]
MKHFSLSALIITITAGLTVCTGSCDSRRWRSTQGCVWSTTYHVTYRGKNDLSDSILATMSRVEKSLSPFDKGSVISLINRNESDRCDSLVAIVTAASRRVWSASGGKFDPTVAPAVNLWGFGYETACGEPTDDAIDSVRAIVGMDRCMVADGRMIKKDSRTQFNFSAITKGLGCDEVAAMMRRNGVDDFMVEIGGEITLGGSNPAREKWHIMIDMPTESTADETRSGLTTIAVTGCGIATSGNYRNYRDTPGGRIGHTIDPLTCRPVKSTTISATVIAPDAMTADALATACMAMEAKAAMAMIEREHDAEAMIVTADSTAANGMKIMSSKGFPL